MKIIKEKAEEYAKTKHKNMNLIDIVSWDFEAGANYVLDAIQSCIDRHEDGCLALESIILTIDELKK